MAVGDVETHVFEDDGGIPNSPLPVLVYHGEVLANIRAVPLPAGDPVRGPGGPLTELWAAGS